MLLGNQQVPPGAVTASPPAPSKPALPPPSPRVPRDRPSFLTPALLLVVIALLGAQLAFSLIAQVKGNPVTVAATPAPPPGTVAWEYRKVFFPNHTPDFWGGGNWNTKGETWHELGQAGWELVYARPGVHKTPDPAVPGTSIETPGYETIFKHRR
jgi:hypothetical protein